MKKVITFLFLLMLVFGFCIGAAAEETWTDYYNYKDIEDAHRYTSPEGERMMPYHVFIPNSYDKKKKYPIVVILHGLGENGDDNRSHMPNYLLDKLVSIYYKQYPAIIILPQCPVGAWWSGVYTDCVMEIVEDVKTRYSTDGDRLYVTGASMGGAGTWDIGARYADRVAALVPVCGAAGPSNQGAWVLRNMPIWIFHGKADTVVSFSVSDNWNNALQAAGNKYVQFTIFGWMDHGIWPAVWNNPNVYEWMFSQIRGKPEVGLLWYESGASATSATQTTRVTTGSSTSTSGSDTSGSNTSNTGKESSSTDPASNKGDNRTGMVLYIILAVAGLGGAGAVLAVLCYRKKRTPKDGGI